MHEQRSQEWTAGYQQGVADMTPEYVVTGDLVVDLQAGEVWAKNGIVPLSATEARFFLALARKVGRTVSEVEISRAVWDTDDLSGISEASRKSYLNTMTDRVRRRLRAAGADHMIYAGLKYVSGRMLVRRPPTGGEEDHVGYSRTEVRSLLVRAAAHIERDEIPEAEGLLAAAIAGLPDAKQSAALKFGRPNHDQRVLDALIELGGEERYVPLVEIARHTKLTPAHAAKALRRARTRCDEIEHRPRRGYWLSGPVPHSLKKMNTFDRIKDWDVTAMQRWEAGLEQAAREQRRKAKERQRDRENPYRIRRKFKGRVDASTSAAPAGIEEERQDVE